MYAIGVDLGGTRIKSVVLDQQGNLLHEELSPTQDNDHQHWKQTVAKAVHELRKRVNTAEVVVGLSAPGLPNENNTAIAHMPGRLQGLEHFIWNDFLEIPAFVINDAVAALMAEVKWGAAMHYKNVVMLTLGTGVGGAILINGQLYQGAFHKAGHVGHMVINDQAGPDITGMPGSLEDCVGNCTLEKRSQGKYQRTEALIDDVKRGDPFAQAIWTQSIRHLAIGLASITNILSPELIVLGGGISQAGAVLFDPLEKFMAQFEWRAGGHKVNIVQAKFSDLAGAIGAASYVMNRVS